MAKKKNGKTPNKESKELKDDKILDLFGKNPGEDAFADIAEATAIDMFNSFDDAEKLRMELMFRLCSLDVTPEDYASFYNFYSHVDKMMDEAEKKDSRKRRISSGYAPLENADDLTLLLRIQMKDVTKPPMWREVEVPANYDFQSLHEVIQEVTGLEDYHLWQFGDKVYGGTFLIKETLEDNDFFVDDVDVLSPDETYLTQFLRKKGDKLEYVYDFGDDWMFTISVKDVIEKRSEYPVCTKFKCDLNALEDFGGLWSYLDAREVLERWDTMSKKQRDEVAENHGFEDGELLHDFLTDHLFDIEEVNEFLERFV
ncbi:MAG: plasmid pRiA4b ORF-3 family protein [Duncaniella sp.]|nr:plasmid pRiA4b ORF-3 family protein [Duncaniella sp.]